MKTQAKTTLQILIAATLVFSFLPLRHSESVSATSSSDLTVDFQIADSKPDGLEIVLSAPTYQIKEIEIDGESFDQIEVAGTVTNSDFGQIQLPVANALIGVPSQAEISLEILEDTAQNMVGQYNLTQAPFPSRIDDINDTQRWDYAQSISVNEINQTNPDARNAVARIAEEAWIRDQRVVRIEYSPFEYNASMGNLIWHPTVRIKVNFSFPDGNLENFSAKKLGLTASPFEAMLETSLLNYDQAKSWRGQPAPTGVQTTPPETGNRYRIAITKDGIYELAYADLFAVDPSIAGFDLDSIQMTSQGEEIAIHVDDGGDGTFGPGDTITFYGQRFYGDQLADLYQDENLLWRTFLSQQTDGSYALWKPEFNALMLEKYTNENVYWLFEGVTNGLRMGTVNGNPSGNSNPPVEHYRKTVRAEESNWWKSTLFAGEETWFSEIISSGRHPYTVTVSAPAATGEATIRSEFVSFISDDGGGFDHHTKIFFNANPTPLSDFSWSGKSRYTYEHDITAASILNGTNTFYIEFLTDAEVAHPTMYFDWFEIEYNRQFKAENNAIDFTSAVTGTQKYQVSEFSSLSNLWVLDITDVNEPVRSPKSNSSVWASRNFPNPL